MSKLFLLLVVVVCVLGLSFGASFEELHKKIRVNSRKNFKEVATTATLGTVGFGVLKLFTASSTCSGTVSFGIVIGTGVCFSEDGVTSAANIVGATTGTVISVTMNTYSDAACTTLETSIVQSGSTTCVSFGAESQIGFFSTSLPSLSSTFGVGTFSGQFVGASCTNSALFTGAFEANGLCSVDSDGTTTTSSSTTCSGSTVTTNEFTTTDCTGTPTPFTLPVPFCSSSTTASGGIQCVSAPESSTCFAGSETVLLSSGAHVLISEVAVGDKVLAANAQGDMSFSEVVAVPHGRNSINAQFTQIATDSQRDIKMTPDHLVLAAADCASFSLVAASAVQAGDCLRTVDGAEKVVSVSVVEGQGVYSLVTKEEFVVVNGVVASPFAGNHAAAHAFYNIHRMLYSLAPAALAAGWVKKANEVFGAIAHSMKL